MLKMHSVPIPTGCVMATSQKNECFSLFSLASSPNGSPSLHEESTVPSSSVVHSFFPSSPPHFSTTAWTNSEESQRFSTGGEDISRASSSSPEVNSLIGSSPGITSATPSNLDTHLPSLEATKLITVKSMENCSSSSSIATPASSTDSIMTVSNILPNENNFEEGKRLCFEDMEQHSKSSVLSAENGIPQGKDIPSVIIHPLQQHRSSSSSSSSSSSLDPRPAILNEKVPRTVEIYHKLRTNSSDRVSYNHSDSDFCKMYYNPCKSSESSQEESIYCNLGNHYCPINHDNDHPSFQDEDFNGSSLMNGKNTNATTTSLSNEDHNKTKQQLIAINNHSPTFIDVTEYLNLPQNEAARKLGVPTSTLSKRWKEAAMNRKWPYRIVCKLDKEIMTLLHNIPQGTENPSLPLEIEQSLGHLLKRRQAELRPVIIRL